MFRITGMQSTYLTAALSELVHLRPTEREKPNSVTHTHTHTHCNNRPKRSMQRMIVSVAVSGGEEITTGIYGRDLLLLLLLPTCGPWGRCC